MLFSIPALFAVLVASIIIAFDLLFHNINKSEDGDELILRAFVSAIILFVGGIALEYLIITLKAL